MLTAEDNRTLTLTGPGSPMGDVFRRYWLPALLSRELPEPDGPPLRVRLLGEDFVAFRDSDGNVGIVEPQCPHRGANLFFGRNEACGLRCVYHGWKFDVHGRCVDLPTLTPDVAERVRPKAHVRALQVREWGDVIWAYCGDDEAPDLPQFEFATLPASHRYVSKKLQQCNWAQACEGGLDTAHFSYLHAGVRDGEKISLLQALPGARPPKAGENEPPNVASFRWMANDGIPQFTVIEHDAGLVLAASRKTDNDDLYWRVTQFLMPNHSLAPGSWPGGNQLGNTWVPIDDHSCWIFCYVWNPDRALTDEERARWQQGSGIFPAMDEQYVPIRNRDNDYLIDRTQQRKWSYTGIDGISEQDAAIADSQGPIADRTRELLGQTDLGIVRFRQMMLAAVKARAAGQPPHGVQAAHAYGLRSGDTVAPARASVTDVLNARFGDRWGIGARTE
jgi:phenylpropionate dioxygenase-like ring-hydroxylating dioxygenase large terminal subunit